MYGLECITGMKMVQMQINVWHRVYIDMGMVHVLIYVWPEVHNNLYGIGIVCRLMYVQCTTGMLLVQVQINVCPGVDNWYGKDIVSCSLFSS